MSVNESVQLEVVIILAKWIDQRLRNFQPANKERKLQGQKERIKQVKSPSLKYSSEFREILDLFTDSAV